jgi:carbonic anhydrase/acetyltransferase-like protein (isoleucine patch superfamily)
MIIEHKGKRPSIDSTASIAPSAVISGDVVIGPYTCVLAGAVLTSEGAPLRIGSRCVIMEHAVIRGAGIHDCTILDHVLVGPHSHISGALVESCCFIATGATILNGAVIGEGSVIAINAIVHIGTHCPAATFVPLGHIAYGDPAKTYPVEKAPEVHAQIAEIGFTNIVFGFDSSQMTDKDATRQLCDRYTAALRSHSNDRVL